MVSRKKKVKGKPKPNRSFRGVWSSRVQDPWLFVIFGLAFAVRIAYLASIVKMPFFDAPVIDAEMYDTRAMNMLNGILPEKIFYQAPMYSLFLAGIYLCFGHNFLAVRLSQFFIGSASCVLVYLTGRTIFGARTGRLAGVAAALYGPLIHYDGELLRPVLVIFIALLMLYAILKWMDDSRLGWAAAAGTLLGISAITRENILLFVPVAVVFLFKFSKGRRWHAPAIFLIFAFVVIVPVTIRNYIVEHDFVPISPQGGMNFYIGNSAENKRLIALQPGIEWDKMAFMPRDELGREARPSQYSSWFFDETLDFIAHNPGRWLRTMGWKFMLFWTGEELAPNSDIEWYRQRAPVLKTLLFRIWFIWVPFGILVPLFVLGVLMKMPRDAKWWLLVSFVLTYMVSVVLFHVRARYRLPVVPVMLPFAAYGLVWMSDTVRTRSWGRFVPALCLITFVAIIINPTWVDTTFARGFPTDYFIAKAYVEKGDDAGALPEFEKAIDRWPEYAELRHDYGQALIRTGRVAEGVARIEEARDLAPDSAFIRKNLGQLYRKESDRLNAKAEIINVQEMDSDSTAISGESEKLIAMAITEYESAGETDPFDVSIKYDLALLYEKAGRDTRFREKLREYIAIARDMPGESEWVRISEGLLRRETSDVIPGVAAGSGDIAQTGAMEHLDRAQFYLRGNNFPEAHSEIMKALELNPQLDNAYALLGNLYKKTNRFSEAEKAYLRAIGINPDNLLALNNLANLYRDAGRFDEALKHYEKAVSLAPDNVVIKKNVIRLKEMMDN